MRQSPMLRLAAALAFLSAAVAGCASSGTSSTQAAATRVARGPARAIWTKERARAWADTTGWLIGSNFGPSTAINQLEMWQASTFAPQTIDRELGLA